MVARIKKGRNGAGSGWSKVADGPERWERRGFGAIVARGPDLWSLMPRCGHDYYAAFSLAEAQAQSEHRSGLCFVCWQHGWSAAPAVVMVVDDDLDIRDALAELLEEHGYSVRRAANGAEAIDVLRSGDVPRVILLDLMMPKMDGYRFRAEQLKDPALANIPVIIITASASVQHDELDAAAVFRKPLELPQLLNTISQHCN